MQRLIGFGQTLHSFLPLPGALCDDGNGAPAIEIVPGRVSAEDGGSFWRRAGPDLTYAFPGVVRFRCEAQRIVADLAAEADPLLAAELLVANALPAALWRAGAFVLHAAGVVLPGANRAIAIAGGSGSGKSTVARFLVAAGARLVGDDSLRVDLTAGGARVSGLAGGTFAPIAADRTRSFVPVRAEQSLRAVPLGAVVVLTERGATPGLARTEKLRAVELLLAHRHRPEIPALLGRREEVLAQTAALARSVPVATWTRAADRSDTTADEVVALRCLLGETG